MIDYSAFSPEVFKIIFFAFFAAHYMGNDIYKIYDDPVGTAFSLNTGHLYAFFV